MKIAIIGYGRMGHMIERIAQERGHSVCARIDVENLADTASPGFREADVAIEFSRPDAAAGNILRAFAAGVPVVSGTTGWDGSLPEVREMCLRGDGTLFHSTNFSVGVYLFRAVNRCLARLMDRFPQYSPSMLEVHHVHKLDHPSGTAITIADDIVAASARLDSWQEPAEVPHSGAAGAGGRTLPVAHERRGEVPGIHTVVWDSPVDSITLSHSAKSREGFALGAVMAAEWLQGRKGFFTMDDMMSEIIECP